MLVLYAALQETLKFLRQFCKWRLLGTEMCISMLMWIRLCHRLVSPRAMQANGNIQQSLRVALILHGFTPMTLFLNITELFSFFLNPTSNWLLQIETKEYWILLKSMSSCLCYHDFTIDNLLNSLFVQRHLCNCIICYNCILSCLLFTWVDVRSSFKQFNV